MFIMFIQRSLENMFGHMVVLSHVTGYDNYMHVERRKNLASKDHPWSMPRAEVWLCIGTIWKITNGVSILRQTKQVLGCHSAEYSGQQPMDSTCQRASDSSIVHVTVDENVNKPCFSRRA